MHPLVNEDKLTEQGEILKAVFFGLDSEEGIDDFLLKMYDGYGVNEVNNFFDVFKQ